MLIDHKIYTCNLQILLNTIPVEMKKLNYQYNLMMNLVYISLKDKGLNLCFKNFDLVDHNFENSLTGALVY